MHTFLVSGYCQSSVRRSLRSNCDFYGAACGKRSQNIVHRLRDVVGLNHLAAVELAVGWDRWRVDEARQDHRHFNPLLAHLFVKRLREADQAEL
jgi:hypothetical protein